MSVAAVGDPERHFGANRCRIAKASPSTINSGRNHEGLGIQWRKSALTGGSQTYQKCVTETAQRFGVFVAKYMGDGVLIHFGYPQAHEDDAERAVRAGL